MIILKATKLFRISQASKIDLNSNMIILKAMIDITKRLRHFDLNSNMIILKAHMYDFLFLLLYYLNSNMIILKV